MTTDIEVEIYNPLRMASNISHVLGENKKIISAFSSLRPAIEGEARILCGFAGSSIAFHNRTNVGINPGPEKPTVIVFFHQGSQCDFKKLHNYLEKLLNVRNDLFINF